MQEWILLALVAAGAGGLAWAATQGALQRKEDQRLQQLVGTRREAEMQQRQGLFSSLLNSNRGQRRRKVEEALEKLQAQQKKKGRVTLRQRLQRAGLQASEKQFYLLAIIMGATLGLFSLMTALAFFKPMTALLLGAGGLVVGGIGIPLLLLRFLTKRRMEKFLFYLPDAAELMVRGLRSGLPLNDAMRTIAEEVPDPVGPEFMEVVEGQKLGIPLDQGLERMYERVPLPEVNFLSIVISIQKETGGNLSEALANLSTVLRARKAMKLKVKAITQEAKVSTYIIGAIPLVLMGAISVLNPGHVDLLLHTTEGNFVLALAAGLMGIGILVMHKMINFKF